MRILLISSAFSGLTQRFYCELADAGHTVSVELHSGDCDKLMEGVSLFQPELIVCPYLTRRIPEELYRQHTCLIVHPGIKGDRGPSSLDWAIQEDETEWGVTLLEAREEMDAGDIWACKTFPMRAATKSSLFYREVTQAAVDCLWEALTYFGAPAFKPEPLDYGKPSVKGRLRPMMKQTDRAIDWKMHKTDDILRRIRAADGSPGLLDEIEGKPFYLFNAHKAEGLHGKPGAIIAVAEHAVCRATVDGAIWIGHLQTRLDNGGKGIKLPAAIALNDLLPPGGGPLQKQFAKPLRTLEIDYTQPGRQLPIQEVWYERDGDIAYIHFPFHNGAMSTAQCRLLLSVYRYVSGLPIKAIVLMGGDEFWSNGIHLNRIENADNPADESWANINAIDDLIHQIITTPDKVTVSAVAGNAGAGGAILAIATDCVWARDGVIFNPHYKNMGGLYGSEYWTYLLPKRVGLQTASELTEQRLPVSAKRAWRIGLIDRVLDKQHRLFSAQVNYLVKTLCADSEALNNRLAEKAKTRCFDEAVKPLSAYRQFELTQMYANFYGNQDYHDARKQFVYKLADETDTPENIASHRRNQQSVKAQPGSLGHFIWRENYRTGDEPADRQHRDVFTLANRLTAAIDQGQRIQLWQQLRQQVEEHFVDEEIRMTQLQYGAIRAHIAEHRAMTASLIAVEQKIRRTEWTVQDIAVFIEDWSRHIVNADMAFMAYTNERAPESVPAREAAF